MRKCLDCTNLDTALQSVAAIVGTNAATLARAVLDYDGSRFDDTSQSPLERMPRDVASGLGVKLEDLAPEGALYFHATRVLDARTIRQEGILPLDRMLESIWEMLFDLVRDLCTLTEWQSFRHDLEAGGGNHAGHLYRIKTRNSAPSFGPFAFLVRSTLFNNDHCSNHDYLACPETVQDIGQAFLDRTGVDLEQRFRDASRPAIVTFRSRKVWTGAMRAALWYLYDEMHEGRVGGNANWGFDGEGDPIRAGDILGVEVLDEGEVTE